MNNSVKYTLDFQAKGLSNITNAGNAIGKMSADFSAITAPLNKITSILNNISNRILQLTNNSRKGLENNTSILNVVNEKLNVEKKKLQEIETQAKKTNSAISSIEQPKQTLFSKLGGFSFNLNNIKAMAQNAVSTFAPVFEEGMAREVASTNFGTLFGDIKLGKEYADTLRNTDMATLYGTNTINQNAQSMLAYGLDKDTTLDVLTAIGDIAMGDANKMSSLATAFSQMSSLGKLQSQDWKQMVGAGFNPFNQMQKDLGKTAEELDAMMAKGQISADMVKNAFINATKEGGQFAGALKNVMSNTLQGKFASLKSKLDDIKAKIFEIVVPLVDKVIPIINYIADHIEVFGTLAAVIGTVVIAVKSWVAVQEFLNLVMTANPIGIIIAGIVALVATISLAIAKYKEFGSALLMIMGPIGVIVNLIMTIKRYWDDIITAFKGDGIISGLKRIGVCILDVILYPLQQVLEWVGKLTDFEWAKNAQTAVNNLRVKLEAINPEEEKTSEDKGILDTGLSSMSQLMQSVNSGLGSDKTLVNATKTSTEAIATGGTRNTQITINLDKMVENINFEGSVSDNKENLTSQMQEILLRVLYSAQMAI